jgi:hypothetical protein
MIFAFDTYKAMAKEEITSEENNSSNDVQSSDCISVLSGNRLASILGPYPTANSKVKSQDSDNVHNSKTSVAEETSHPTSNIGMAEQHASSSVSVNEIGGHLFNDVKETNIAIKKSILTILNKPSR